MSSFPARMAKRALKSRDFVREYRKVKGCDEAFPHRVLDTDGKPVALTWAQAARPSGKPGKKSKGKPPKPRRAVSRAERTAARKAAAKLRKARVSAQGKVLAKRKGGFTGHTHGQPCGIHPHANLSKRHPDYGCSPVEHARRKTGRA